MSGFSVNIIQCMAMSGSKQRKIIHCDCDCFYASIEMRDDPRLRARPMAVGGRSDRRGVITTCNYEAREFGVHSAMASATALRLCPDLLIVPPNMEKYRQASKKIRAIFYQYTDLVEPLSLDEAYLDVSESDCCRGSATLMAVEIRQRIHKEVGITISAGIAPNKFLAKICSDWNKPNGQFVILPEEVDAFVEQLRVDKLFGVGQVTAKKLDKMGVRTCGQLRAFNVFELTERFGRFGKRLYELSRGIDDREIEVSHRRKSLSVEHTYSQDLPDVAACLQKLPELNMQLKSRLKRVDESFLITKQFIKLKFNNFSVTTMECSAPGLRLKTFEKLCSDAYERGHMPVRLIGIGVRFIDLLEQRNPLQLELFPSSN